jgi:nuclear pore complex protein Nup98-Nup96
MDRVKLFLYFITLFNLSVKADLFVSSMQWPYERQDKTLTMDETEQAFHDAARPTWGPDETLVLTSASPALNATAQGAGVLAVRRPLVQTEKQDVRLANFSAEVRNQALLESDLN